MTSFSFRIGMLRVLRTFFHIFFFTGELGKNAIDSFTLSFFSRMLNHVQSPPPFQWRKLKSSSKGTPFPRLPPGTSHFRRTLSGLSLFPEDKRRVYDLKKPCLTPTFFILGKIVVTQPHPPPFLSLVKNHSE